MDAMSDRAKWLEEWCRECGAAPGSRCRQLRRGRSGLAAHLHVARGWRARRCPSCRACAGEACRTPAGGEASRPHAARLVPGRAELLGRDAVWAALERCGAAIAALEFSGRAGEGGKIGSIGFNDADGRWLGKLELWGSDELAFALAAPVWDRYGQFAGLPAIRGTVTWAVRDRRVVIAGQRGHERFE